MNNVVVDPDLHLGIPCVIDRIVRRSRNHLDPVEAYRQCGRSGNALNIGNHLADNLLSIHIFNLEDCAMQSASGLLVKGTVVFGRCDLDLKLAARLVQRPYNTCCLSQKRVDALGDRIGDIAVRRVEHFDGVTSNRQRII